MKRRVFLKKTAIVASAASFAKMFLPLTASGMNSKKSSQISNQIPMPSRATQEDIRSADYLLRSKNNKFLPKIPEFAALHLSPEVRVSSMPLKERLRRGIVPRRGFCSTLPGATLNAGLTTGNGHMNIEVACDPYSEQVLFRHESLLVPWKRPFEAPNPRGYFRKCGSWSSTANTRKRLNLHSRR